MVPVAALNPWIAVPDPGSRVQLLIPLPIAIPPRGSGKYPDRQMQKQKRHTTVKRVVVGLSGGVDSSVAAYLLKEQGYDVVGLFMRNWHDTTGTLEGDCPWYDDQMFAELTAKRLDIPFHFIDLSDEYRRRVVDYMFAEYGRGRTPNPDVLCNREIKFDAFLQAALKLGADYVATGALLPPRSDQKRPKGRSTTCSRATTRTKTRAISSASLRRSSFRARSSRSGTCSNPKYGASRPNSTSPPRSARIRRASASSARWTCRSSCSSSSRRARVRSSRFRPRGRGMLRGRIAAPGERSTAWELPADGPFSQEQLDALAEPYRYTPEAGRQAGTHRGAHFFTIGQRKGLGVGGYAEPVVRDRERRGTQRTLRGHGPGASGTLPACAADPARRDALDPARPRVTAGRQRPLSMRIRYRQPLQGGVLHVTEQGGYIVFDRPQRGVTVRRVVRRRRAGRLRGNPPVRPDRKPTKRRKGARRIRRTKAYEQPPGHRTRNTGA